MFIGCLRNVITKKTTVFEFVKVNSVALGTVTVVAMLEGMNLLGYLREQENKE